MQIDEEWLEMSKIPKIIHYIWIGNNEKPEIVKRCIESWKKYLPEFKIIEWNESNYDIHKSEYLMEAYNKKKWAFASDYMRFDILNKYGGIYVDTDVEFLQTVPEEILDKKSFTCVEFTGKVNPGLIYACEKGDWLAGLMIESYNQDYFDADKLITVNQRITEILSKYGYIEKNEFQYINGLSIYPANIFCGFDTYIMEYAIEPETISVHHYTGTWTNDGIKRKIQKVIKKVFGIRGYRKILDLKRSIKGD